MICDPCRKAGSFLKAANLAATDSFRALAFGTVQDLHATCEAPLTCPCHHRTESVLRP